MAPKTLNDYVALARVRGLMYLGSKAPANVFVRVPWRCRKGHRWETTYSSVSKNVGCLHCSGNAKKTLEDYRSLAQDRGFTCLAVSTPRSVFEKVPWKCRKGHRWMAKYNVISNGHGCPFCAGVSRKTVEDYRAAARRNGVAFVGNHVPPNTTTKVWWRCRKGHRWEATYASVGQTGNGCPYCSRKAPKTLDDYHALAKRRGFIFLEKGLPKNTETSARWKCAAGHIWETTYASVAAGAGCHFCSHTARKTIADYRALARKRGFIFVSIHAPPNANAKGSWRCSKGHVWQARYGSIYSGTGCPHCAGRARKTLADYRDLARRRGLVFVGRTIPLSTGRNARWRCAAGHEWEAPYGNIRSGSGCPQCWARRRELGAAAATSQG